MEKFKHKKSLGQNFLKDEKVLKDIAHAIETKENDLIIEIGPGQGALTKYLVEKPGHVICYEIDDRVYPYLKKYESDKCRIIMQDFMQVDFFKDIKDYSYDNLYFIANLPYYITTPIIEKILNLKKAKAMVFMVQKEVANRLAAKPKSKEYGSLTVYLNYYYDIIKLFEVGRALFEPAPNVDSAVVLFQKHNKKYTVKNEEQLFKLIKDSFKMKRKNIRNNLRNYDLETIEKVLIKHNLDLNARAEELSLDIFVDIVNNL